MPGETWRLKSFPFSSFSSRFSSLVIAQARRKEREEKPLQPPSLARHPPRTLPARSSAASALKKETSSLAASPPQRHGHGQGAAARHASFAPDRRVGSSRISSAPECHGTSLGHRLACNAREMILALESPSDVLVQSATRGRIRLSVPGLLWNE